MKCQAALRQSWDAAKGRPATCGRPTVAWAWRMDGLRWSPRCGIHSRTGIVARLVRDDDAAEWRLELPTGWQFSSGAHALCEPWGPARRSPAEWIADARAAIVDRLMQAEAVECPADCECRDYERDT